MIFGDHINLLVILRLHIFVVQPYSKAAFPQKMLLPTHDWNIADGLFPNFFLFILFYLSASLIDQPLWKYWSLVTEQLAFHIFANINQHICCGLVLDLFGDNFHLFSVIFIHCRHTTKVIV